MRRLVVATRTMLVLVGTALALSAGSSLTALQAPAPQTGGSKSANPPVKPEDLDRLLAPIALYPDRLLSQMLLCASNPGKVGALNQWLASNQTLKGTELQDAATKSGFDQSFAGLALFPQVVSMMAEQVPWTTQLGQAFAADRGAVFASIQRLRKRAHDAGTLKTSPQQEVTTKVTTSGQQVIVIEPSNPQVVYVPQYDPQVVYTQPATSTTVVVQEESNADEVAAGLIGFTAGIAMGAAIDNDYYYGPYGWSGGFYMYDDAWDDWYDAREDVREDWQDNRQDLYEERGDLARSQQEQRTERQQNLQENRPESQGQRRTEAGAAVTEARSSGTSSLESRGYSRDADQAARDRSGTRSDAFSGYSSGRSERSASSRGQSSRSSWRGGGGRRR